MQASFIEGRVNQLLLHLQPSFASEVGGSSGQLISAFTAFPASCRLAQPLHPVRVPLVLVAPRQHSCTQHLLCGPLFSGPSPLSC